MQVSIEEQSRKPIMSSGPETEKKEFYTLREYQQEIFKHFSKENLKRNPKRLFYAVAFSMANIGIIALILLGGLHWSVNLVLSLVMGAFWAGNVFVAHELLHGSIVQNKSMQTFVSFFLFTPFVISPTFWSFWHNFLHHGNTQLVFKDPDAFPTRSVWKQSRYMRMILPLTPGSRNPLSYLYFFWWFSFQALFNQFYMRFQSKMWDKLDHKRVNIELFLQVMAAGSYVYFIGAESPLFLILVPWAIMNYTVMSYISTNHNLSPYTKINDPLVNSLTVTNNSILERVHLNFGYHTEHHLFPTLPMNRAKELSEVLKKIYPKRYMTMKKSRAVRMLYSTPRLYKNKTTLVNPKSGAEFPTITAKSLHH